VRKVDLSTKEERKAYVERVGLRLDWEWAPGLPGTVMIYVLIETQAFPVGMLWMTPVGNMISIKNIYVVEQMRGAGVARAMIDFVFDEWEPECLVTGGGTELGEGFMTATGWREQKNGDWKLKPGWRR